MDAAIKCEFDKLNLKVDEISLKVAKLEQHKEDNATSKLAILGIWKIFISIVTVGILAFQIWG